MNCCHLCSIIAKKQQMVLCNNCSNEYCLKCAKDHLSYPVIQKIFPQHSLEQIQEVIKIKKWLCFSCQKVCICKPCKGVGMANVERVILGKRDKVSLKKNIDDYKQYNGRIEMFKSIDFGSLSPFEQQYFMNKVMLYAKPKNDTVISLKEISMKGVLQSEKQQKKQEIIMIDSDENHQVMEVQAPKRIIIKEQFNGPENIEEQNAEKKQKKSQKMSIEVQNNQNFSC